MIPNLSRALCAVVVGLAVLAPSGAAGSGQQRDAEGRKPSLSLRATPTAGVSPLRVRANLELRDGSDDYADFYCPAVEWEWGDGTSSEASVDCAPYEAGKSVIQRRYTSDHVYRGAGSYRLVFKIKQRNRQVAAVSTTVTVRGGPESPFDR